MTCGQVEQLKDAFLDGELSGHELLDVARHTATCPSCDEVLQGVAALQDLIARGMQEAAADIDLSGVWAAVESNIDRQEAQARWRRRWRTVPMWTAGLAVAASVFFWVQPGTHERAREVVASVPRPMRQVALRERDHAYIDSLRGKNVTARRDPKAGTIIWVNYPGGLDQ